MIKKIIAAKIALKKKISSWRESADSFLEKWEREHASVLVNMTSTIGSIRPNNKIKEVNSYPWGSSIKVQITNTSSKSKWIHACHLNISFGKDIQMFFTSDVGEIAKVRGFLMPLNRLIQSQERVDFNISVPMSRSLSILRQSEGARSLVWAEIEMQTGEMFQSEKMVFLPEYSDMMRNRY